MSDSALAPLFRELAALFAPLSDVSGSPDAVTSLLRDIGWDISPDDPLATALTESLTAAAGAVEVVVKLAEHPPEQLDELADALTSVEHVAVAVTKLAQSLPAGSPAELEALPLELLESLTLSHVRRRAPVAYDLLYLLGVVGPALRTGVVANGTQLRRDHLAHTIDGARIGALLSDPAGALRALYKPNALETQSDVDGLTAVLYPRLALLLGDLGAQVLTGRGGWTLPGLSDDDARALDSMLTAAWPLLNAGGELAQVGATVRVLPADAGRAGLYLAPFGAVDLTLTTGGWSFEVKAATDVPGLLIAADGVELPALTGGSAPADLDLGFSISRIPGPSGKLVIGAPSGTRLQVGQLTLAAGLHLSAAGHDLALSLDLSPASLVIGGGDGDGFLQQALPRDGFQIDFDLSVKWSSSAGLRISGGAGLQLTATPNQAIGPLVIQTLSLTVRAAEAGIQLAASAGVRLGVGPFTAVVSGIGIEGELTLGTPGNLGNAALRLGFKPPSGIGLSMTTAAVRGGGFLLFDPDAGRYAGVFELTIADVVSVKAIALITTKLPSGGDGFALLVIITAEGFTPVPLGFGFELTGIGGLLALNRSVDADAVRNGLRDGVLDSVLFVKDPVANVNRVLTTLDRVFPLARDRLLVGPLAEISWGTPAIVKIRLALLLELPDPVRIVLLAALSAVLPDESHPVVQLHVDAIGVLDLGRGSLALDASLHDSRLLQYTLSGDMALRLNWGDAPTFLLSIGGFHPRFKPPAGMRRLERMALSLSAGNNPRVRLEAYLALTSNSIQMGARVTLYAAAGGFGIDGGGAFDALVQWSPFAVDVGFEAWVRIFGPTGTLLAARVSVDVTGPGPWHVTGVAEVHLLFFSVKVGIDFRIGESVTAPPQETVDVAAQLWAAVADPGAWQAALPPGQPPGATLATTTDRLVVHPFATLAVRQKVVPLDTAVTRVGARLPKDGARSYGIDLAGPAGTRVEPLRELFAPAQYKDLKDDEKLTSGAFVAMNAGAALRPVDEHAIAKDGVLATTLEFETLDLSELDAEPENVGRTSARAGSALAGPRLAADSRATWNAVPA